MKFNNILAKLVAFLNFIHGSSWKFGMAFSTDPDLLHLCDGFDYVMTNPADPHAALIALPTANDSVANKKLATAAEGGTVSITARVELLRQVCQSPGSSRPQRVDAARSIVGLCMATQSHQHVSHRIGLRISTS